MSSNNKKGLTAFAILIIYKSNINKGVIMKTKEYYYEQECRDICEAIQDLDFGDVDFQPTMSEMVNKVMDTIGKPIFHTYDEIQDMIVDYCNEKGGN
jgi:hypothetical protein